MSVSVADGAGSPTRSSLRSSVVRLNPRFDDQSLTVAGVVDARTTDVRNGQARSWTRGRSGEHGLDARIERWRAKYRLDHRPWRIDARDDYPIDADRCDLKERPKVRTR